MPTEFTLAGFARALARAADAQPDAERRGLTDGIKLIEADAKASLGTYQQRAGPFRAWAPLAESTQEQRERAGYTPDDPLLRSGELRDSITHEVGQREAATGTTRPEGAYLENGTKRMPARPFMGPAAVRKGHEATEAIAERVFGPLVHGRIR